MKRLMRAGAVILVLIMTAFTSAQGWEYGHLQIVQPDEHTRSLYRFDSSDVYLETWELADFILDLQAVYPVDLPWEPETVSTAYVVSLLGANGWRLAGFETQRAENVSSDESLFWFERPIR